MHGTKPRFSQNGIKTLSENPKGSTLGFVHLHFNILSPNKKTSVFLTQYITVTGVSVDMISVGI